MKTQQTFKQIYNALKNEKSFYLAVLVYSIFISLISVAIPISVQSLVNTVTFGVVIQPIVVVTLLLLTLLLVSTFLNTFMIKVIENFNYHFFARSVERITKALLGSSTLKLVKMNHVSFANRYFDIMTVQKSMATILSEGIYIVLQIFIGMLLISLYHPYFLIFDLILITCLFLIWKIFGESALKTAILESKQKYAVASWLNELSRLNILFKRHSDFAFNKSETLVKNYINTRKTHFRFLLAQIIGLLLLYALLSAFVLGVGGFLVIKGELSIGQLVAAELIVTLILTSLSKSGKLLEKLYDLTGAIDKLEQFNDIKGKEVQVLSGNKDKIEVHLPIFDKFISASKFRLELNCHKNYKISSLSLNLKNWFLGTLIGRQELDGGQIILPYKMNNSISRQESFYRTFYVLSYPEIFHGSFAENLLMETKSSDHSEILNILNLVGLKDKILNMDAGLETQLYPCGYPLVNGDLILLDLARSILVAPLFIVITDIFKTLPKLLQDEYLDYIKNETNIKIIFLNESYGSFEYENISLEECCQ